MLPRVVQAHREVGLERIGVARRQLSVQRYSSTASRVAASAASRCPRSLNRMPMRGALIAQPRLWTMLRDLSTFRSSCSIWSASSVSEGTCRALTDVRMESKIEKGYSEPMFLESSIISSRSYCCRAVERVFHALGCMNQ